jgi:hypothetical protein
MLGGEENEPTVLVTVSSAIQVIVRRKLGGLEDTITPLAMIVLDEGRDVDLRVQAHRDLLYINGNIDRTQYVQLHQSGLTRDGPGCITWPTTRSRRRRVAVQVVFCEPVSVQRSLLNREDTGKFARACASEAVILRLTI